MGAWIDRPRFLQDFHTFRAELFDGRMEICRDDTEVVVRIADLRAVRGHLFGGARATNEQIDAVQSHAQVYGSAGVVAAERLGAEHLAIEPLGSVEIAAHQVHVIESELHVALPEPGVVVDTRSTRVPVYEESTPPTRDLADGPPDTRVLSQGLAPAPVQARRFALNARTRTSPGYSPIPAAGPPGPGPTALAQRPLVRSLPAGARRPARSTR